ncbi:hypothetical protein ROTO_32310 [Roseovarius tolerans]|uniref:Uncharacterized protein n=1 Tax=Roseovarius tolerans TaxID=74031 RepID=A0A0L6CRC8_9RHOB|nr:hypothetical protein [Roseovarius tolerans]KNX40215.1 hypothetical protein ROTO_32310 [Roseovarius tolerans]
MTPDPFTAYPARGWLRSSAGIAFMLGGLLATFAVFMTTQEIDFFDLRFVSILFLIAPPVLLVSGALLWRMSNWTDWVLRIDETGLTFRSATSRGRLLAPEHMPWHAFARAEFSSAPKTIEMIQLSDMDGNRHKLNISNLTFSRPRIVAALEDWLNSARVPYTKRGWDVVLLDRVVIERVAQA